MYVNFYFFVLEIEYYIEYVQSFFCFLERKFFFVQKELFSYIEFMQIILYFVFIFKVSIVILVRFVNIIKFDNVILVLVSYYIVVIKF